MSIDLERSLDELARSVHDDALAERMNGQVYRMVSQIKRRRAARYTGTSVIGMSAAAAVVVGGVQLADRGEGSRPVATQPPSPAPTEACDGPAPTPTDTPDLVLQATVPDTVAYGEPVQLQLFLVNVLSMSVAGYPPVDVAVLQDGVVVGTAQLDPVAFGLTDGVDPSQSEVTVTPCVGDSPLLPGEYALVATARLDLSDGTTRTAVSDAVPFRITGSDQTPLDQQTAGLDAVDEIVATADERADEFGVCGSVVPPETDAPVALTLTLEDRVYAAGEAFAAPVTVVASDAVPEDAQLTANHPQIVLTRGGVVVGGAATEDALPIELGPDGTGTLRAPAAVLICSLPGADAPSETPLPAGTYQAYATFTLTVAEPALDGVEPVPWEPVVVRSRPVDITIG